MQNTLGANREDGGNQRFNEQINIQVKHIFREVNQLADYITNITINQAKKKIPN